MAGYPTIFEIEIKKALNAVFSRFRQDFQPIELEGELRDIIKLNRTEFIEGSYVPNEFLIYLSPSDYEGLRPLKKELIEDLIGCISHYIQESGNQVIGAKEGRIADRILIELQPDPDGKLGKGEVRIEPNFRR